MFDELHEFRRLGTAALAEERRHFPHVLNRLQAWLRGIGGLQSLGRQGAFSLDSVGDAMRMGLTAAANVIGEADSARGPRAIPGERLVGEGAELGGEALRTEP